MNTGKAAIALAGLLSVTVFTVHSPAADKKLLITSDYGSLTVASNNRTYEEVDRILDVFRSARPDIVTIDVANPDAVRYRTEVGHYRPSESIDALYAAGQDPYAYCVNALREASIQVLAGVRMNDHHGNRNNWVPWSRAHTEWSLGPQMKGPGILDKDVEEMSWREIGAMRRMDYAQQGVREHRLAIIAEILELFDVDGIQLDFNRLAPFLSEPKRENARYMTEFIRGVRALLDAGAEDRGRPMLLGAIVPWDIEFCRREGLDVDSWVSEGLVDYLAPGEWYYADWNIDIRPWSKLVEDTAVELYPLVCGNVSQTRRHHWGYRPLLGNNRRLDGPKISSMAETYYHQGAGGIMLYNFYAHGHAGRYYPALRSLTDPAVIPHLWRHYYFIRHKKYVPCEVYTFGSGHLGRTSPAFYRFYLSEAGDRCAYTFRLGSVPSPSPGLFRFKLVNHQPGDRLAVYLNGQAVEARRMTRFKAQDPYDDTEFLAASWEAAAKAPPLRAGNNLVEVELLRDRPGEPLGIAEFEVWLPGTSESTVERLFP